ncbi:uncharacterized protein DS421_19g652600 [Arachis hypogaea]|uniref:Uncharacterized protein n=1 Tax=Arachis hypogaea TaxID=3818 RepID=A0A6B9V6U9_ARAHY|nr:uncharacterized protein DS421_19g652600 [Arachis hypogaea]
MRELPPWRSRRVSAVAARYATAEASDHASTAGNAPVARDPLPSLERALPIRVFKLGFYSFGFWEPLSSLRVYFSYLPPLLVVVLNCCTVVATVRVTGNVAVITGTTIGVTVISVQPFVLVWDRVMGLDY